MSRPQKKGLDYFPFDVGFFADKKIKALRGRYGADGVTVYLYLLCGIYQEGYYTLWDEDFLDAAIADLGMSEEKIGQIMNFLFGRSLLDGTLARTEKVLTSHGIQRRFQEGVRSRGQKNPVTVDSRFWLLSKDETQGFIKVRPNTDNSGKNIDYSEKNPSYSGNNDTKKSKVKKSKEKESISQTGHLEEGFRRFWEIYPRKQGKQEAEKAWKKLAPDEELLERLLTALGKARTCDQWSRDNGRYIPYPATWLNQKRWEDEYPVSAARAALSRENDELEELEKRLREGGRNW